MRSKKEITIYDIAASLNLSSATVSRGLKDHPAIRKETKKRILEKAKEMGYRHNLFASNLRRNRTNTIGVIVPRLNSYFMSSVISGIEKVANEAGYNLVISQSLESEKKEMVNIRTMFNTRVDGLLVSLAYDTEDDSHFRIILDKNIPLIFFDRVFEHPMCTSVIIDNFAAGYAMTEHLIQQGCKRIVHITANLKRNVYAERLRGYKQALADHKLPYDESLIFVNNLSEDACLDAIKTILNMDPLPDGMFSSNDSSAVVCIRELKKAGIKIPQQIAIGGFNNEPISTVIEPNLTTIHYPGQEMGEVCASLLIRKLAKPDNADLNRVVLRHQLIIRDSSLKKPVGNNVL
ncbi:MAG TPA: LacI family DNA-binding transcriptional regulator [Chryseosolibacter sp.]|nr:LacI family DNA-binding transcriptional regulator [Chryseosolibacter sp.]